ncbi:ABC transporter permease [Natronolimnobius sp. AArcel1]|uniref:ABC transporter permease n=1 Tax=Natronolimnobius sp. AArcel1 TaxID=1679093 RepID=UPI0013EB4FCC|nr:ABC transporter permease [Natronolimnobius sp. AArcel1]NGM67581.1 ABC transporter permease [Natronolimnobius sp. AArcel1]
MLDATVLERIGIAVGSTVSALLIGLVIVAISGYNPVEFASQLLVGSFGSERAVARTLRYSVLFVLAGVAVAIAFRAGVFNIGVQGQFIVGGFATVVSIITLAPYLPNGTGGGVALMLIGTVAAIAAGGLYAALPGVLKAYGGANEIITTIMLNFIAIGFVGWLVAGRFGDPQATATRTEHMPENVGFPSVIFDDPNLSIVGIVLTLVVVALIAAVMTRTSFGYDMVTSGTQEAAATYSGVDAKRMIVSTMTLSGMVAGLAGAIFAIMIQGYFTDPSGIGNYGFDAIAVSLLAANNPIGVIPAGLLFGGLESAGSHIQISTDVPVQLIDGIVGLVVLFVAVPELFRMIAKRTGLGGDGE